jgi:hypothetical protein
MQCIPYKVLYTILHKDKLTGKSCAIRSTYATKEELLSVTDILDMQFYEVAIDLFVKHKDNWYPVSRDIVGQPALLSILNKEVKQLIH